MVRYRRQSNCLGWAVFFGVGAAVFVGLIFAVIVLKKKMAQDEAAEKKAGAAASAAAESPTRGKKPVVLVKEWLSKTVYTKSGYDIRAMNDKEVPCGKYKRNVVIAHVLSESTGDTNEANDHFIIIDRGNVTGGKWEDWERVKGEYGIDQDP